MNQKRISIIAGEASGDLYAADLVKNIQKVNPHIKFFGMGGTKMQQAGVNLLINMDDLSVIGILTKSRFINSLF